MKKIIYIIFIINIFSCKTKTDKMKIIAYDTKEFNFFEKKALIKKEKAWELHLNYYKSQNKEFFGTLFFVIDDNYVFSTNYNPKIPEVSLTGVYVNSETGETMFKENNQKLQPASQFGWRP